MSGCAIGNARFALKVAHLAGLARAQTAPLADVAGTLCQMARRRVGDALQS
jgi:hypothetical protein